MNTDCQVAMLCSGEILDEYLTCGTIRTKIRSLLLNCLHRWNPALPDHTIRNYLDSVLPSSTGTKPCQPLLGALEGLATSFLEFTGKDVYVKGKSFEEWQRHLTRIAPLPLLAYRLYQEYIPDFSRTNDRRSMIERVAGTLRFSTLPTSYHASLEELIEKEKLIELHLHLNGTTEIDRLWQDALRSPRKFYDNFNKALVISRSASERSAVQELFLDNSKRTARDLYIRLRIAGQLRLRMINEIRSITTASPFSLPQLLTSKILSSSNLLPPPPANQHGIESWHTMPAEMTMIGKEAIFLMAVFDRLKRSHDEQLATKLHVYLLLQADFTKLVVQQLSQKGFDQFQKITWNEMRSYSEQVNYNERVYYKRFRQLDGMYRPYLQTLEGRFAPKKTKRANVKFLKEMLGDYGCYLDYHFRMRYAAEQNLVNGNNPAMNALCAAATTFVHGISPDDDYTRDYQSLPSAGRPATKSGMARLAKRTNVFMAEWAMPQHYTPKGTSLKLIAHFIKRNDSNASLCRYHELRLENQKVAQALINVRKREKTLMPFLVGADAASNELHTPPEVYAPVFRLLRRNGWRNFTYHVGEDFVHLISGIRAVYEAIIFLDLKGKSRLGHATAIGIDPELWLDRMPKKIVMRQGEHLDNLIFTSQMLLDDPTSASVMHKLNGEIQSLFQNIYGQNFPGLPILVDAWHFRKYDPLRVLGYQLRRSSTDKKEWPEWDDCEEDKKCKPEAFQLFERYHSKISWDNYDKLDEFDTDIINEKSLRHIQAKVLEEVHKRGIAIETMPTSNVRISVYNSYKEHHIFRWLGLKEDKNSKGERRPTVCIASDNPGIFATNLRNEFAHVFNSLVNDYKIDQEEAITILKRINENCRVYRFEEKPS